MKTSYRVVARVMLTAVGAWGQVALLSQVSALAEAVRAPDVQDTPYAVVERGPHHRVWQRVVYEPTPFGTRVPRVHQYNELATGMHFRSATGEWVESKEEFELMPGKAVARQGQHSVSLNYNLNSAGAVEMQTPDGKLLRSHVLGFSYYDTASGQSVLIAEVKDCEGRVAGNQVIYADAFTDFKADVRYTYTKAGFEQDVVLREQPPGPEAYGLDPATTRLQVLTEFMNPPQPVKRAGAIKERDGREMVDEYLDFGVMEMWQGKAFMLGSSESAKEIPVGKQWLKLEGRDFLVEEVGVTEISQELQRLPAVQGASVKPAAGSQLHVVSRQRLIPAAPSNKADPGEMRLADLPPTSSGLVLDYQTINGSQSNYTFKGGTTYYISSIVNLNGTNVLEGNTVVKYAVGFTSLNVLGQLRWETDAYRPAILTAKDDDTVGERINGSTGSPNGYYAGYGFNFNAPTSPIEMKYTHVRYASTGILIFSGGAQTTHRVRNCQFWNVGTGVSAGGTTVELENVLFHRVGQKAIGGDSSSTVRGSHLTLHQVNKGLHQGAASFTNSLFVWVTNWPTAFTSVNNATNNDSSIFQTVGDGAHYLATDTYRNVGITNINPGLLADLRKKTTYPPMAYTNVTFSSAMIFPPQAQRDTDIPDLGYHYDPLDYNFGGCTANSNMTFTAGTAVGWFRTSSGWYHAGQGIRMKGNITVAFNGTATSPTYFARLNTVQEQDRTAGYGHGGIENWEQPYVPVVLGRFLRCTAMAGECFDGYFSDDYGPIRAEMTHSEFWSGSLHTYGDYMLYTNCLMWRLDRVGLDNGSANSSFTMRNCTLIGGRLYMNRNSSPPTPVSVRDCAFDGTTITVNDYYGNNQTYTDYDYNAYTNATIPFPLGGANDQKSVTFNWQTSWLGNYYLPSNSQLINAGSVASAASVSLYHFTTQTNQVNETDSPVDIGYHYVAVNNSGQPVDDDGDGIPDYIEDANGNGVVDFGETDWQNASDLGLKLIITSPRNGSMLP